MTYCPMYVLYTGHANQPETESFFQLLLKTAVLNAILKDIEQTNLTIKMGQIIH